MVTSTREVMAGDRAILEDEAGTTTKVISITRAQGSQPGGPLDEFDYKQRSLMRAAEYKRMMRLRTGGTAPPNTGNAGGEEPLKFCIIHDSRSHTTADCQLLRDIYPQTTGTAGRTAPQTSDLRPHKPGKLVGRSAPKIELNLIKKDGPVKRNGKSNNALFLELVIEGEEYQGMVDTGASNCFISKEVRNQLPPEAIWDTLLPDEKTVRFGDRTHSRIHETIRLKCSFDGIYVYYNFHVMETLAHPNYTRERPPEGPTS